jgi:beta-mannosidase
MRPAAPACILAAAAALGEGIPLSGNWVWRPVTPAAAEGAEVAPEAWRALSAGNRRAGDFSLARQLAEAAGTAWVRPSGFEAERDIELGVVFRVPAELRGNVELVFDRIDTFAEVYLDGEAALESDNAFRIHRLPLPAKDGDRQLLVRLSATRDEARRREAQLPRAAVGGERVVARRPQLGFGGAVAPATLDLGLDFPRLVAWEGAVVREAAVLPAAPPALGTEEGRVICRRAELRLELRVDADADAEAVLTVACREAKAESNVALRKGPNTLSLPFALDNPPLWWVRDMGLQEMPVARWELRLGERVIAGERRFGIRDLRLERTPDERGESFAFRLNGRPLPIRGAHLLPANALQPHRSDLAALGLAAEAGVNLVRVWAGGGYADRDLMSRCDQLGILVWQDLPFLEAPYPLDDARLEGVLEEVRQQARRLRAHPSLALWCGLTGAAEGRDEGEWADRLGTPRAIAETRTRQARIFGEILPRTLAELDPFRPYLPESPRLGWRREASYRMGDLWYRGLEEGLESLEIAQGRTGRFLSGFGAVSHPSPAVMRAWPASPEADLGDPEAYLTSASRTAEILAHRMGEEGLRPAGPAARAFASRWLQAEAVRILASAQRDDPGGAGSILWHLNDCWPASSAAVVDFTGDPKPAYFALRQAYADETVRLWFQGDTVHARAVGGRGGILLRLLDVRGNVVREARAEGGKPVQLGRLRPGEAAYALAEAGTRRLIRPLPPAYRGLDPALGRAAYRVEARRDTSTSLGFAELTVTAESVVVGLCLEPLLPGARAMDGLVDLLPGERHVIRVRLAQARDWRASFRPASWHDLGVAPVPLGPEPPR